MFLPFLNLIFFSALLPLSVSGAAETVLSSARARSFSEWSSQPKARTTTFPSCGHARQCGQFGQTAGVCPVLLWANWLSGDRTSAQRGRARAPHPPLLKGRSTRTGQVNYHLFPSSLGALPRTACFSAVVHKLQLSFSRVDHLRLSRFVKHRLSA